MNNQLKAYGFGLGAVLIWSTVASAFKLSLRYLSPTELLFYSVLCSTCLLMVIVLLQGKLRLLMRAGGNQWRVSILFGLLNPFLYYTVLFRAYDLLPAQQAQPINFTWAITLSLLAVPLLGQKLNRYDLIAIFTSYFGVYIISTNGELFSFRFENMSGVILALSSTVIWALYWIFNTKDGRDPVVGLCMNFVISLGFVSLLLWFDGGFRLIPLKGFAGALYVGCFEMGISFVLWLQALKYTNSTAKIANLIFLSPFISLILIHLLVGEEIMPSSLIGLIFIIGGISVQSFGKKT